MSKNIKTFMALNVSNNVQNKGKQLFYSRLLYVSFGRLSQSKEGSQQNKCKVNKILRSL